MFVYIMNISLKILIDHCCKNKINIFNKKWTLKKKDVFLFKKFKFGKDYSWCNTKVNPSDDLR
jgi:hypothetical protein